MKSVLQDMLNGPFDPAMPPPCCSKEVAVSWHDAALKSQAWKGKDPLGSETMETFCEDCTASYRSNMASRNKCLRAMLEKLDGV